MGVLEPLKGVAGVYSSDEVNLILFFDDCIKVATIDRYLDIVEQHTPPESVIQLGAYDMYQGILLKPRSDRVPPVELTRFGKTISQRGNYPMADLLCSHNMSVFGDNFAVEITTSPAFLVFENEAIVFDPRDGSLNHGTEKEMQGYVMELILCGFMPTRHV